MRKTIAQYQAEATQAEKEINRLIETVKAKNETISEKNEIISEIRSNLDAHTQKHAQETTSRVISKTVLVEKLKDGFMVKEFTGERTSPKITRTKEVNLSTDVAGNYIQREQDITTDAIDSTQKLLKECASGAKYLLKVEVLIAK